MIQTRKPLIQRPGRPGHKSPDVIVIGAGIFGLWAARHALKRGESVMVLEKRSIGDGASGGFLGALMPHMPDNWNAKKQMQFEALGSLGMAIQELEDDTGFNCGYRRCGRLIPMTHEKMLAHAEKRIEGAKANWIAAAGKPVFEMQLLKPEDLLRTEFGGRNGGPWLDPEVAKFGATYDSLSARVNPRAYLTALGAYVRSQSHSKGEIVEGMEAVNVAVEVGVGVTVTLRNGDAITAGRVVIANGWEAYGLLGKMSASIGGQPITGRGVKGQAVLLDHDHDDRMPIVYDNGSYIVPHEGNKVAIGSTSVDDWLPDGLSSQQFGNHELEADFGGVNADHPGRPASVEPAQNRDGYDDGPLPEFTEMPQMVRHAENYGLVLASESFAGELASGDPLAEKLLDAAARQFDREDMAFYDYALKLCPSLNKVKITERWANVRPRNTVPDAISGKTGTEPIFGELDGSENVQVKLGGFKISLGVGHVDYFVK